MSILIFVIALSVLVLIHELGHFLVARLFKVKADEFGIGFPPRIFGFVRDEKGKWKHVSGADDKAYKNTIWSFNWLPLGGFVRIKGEQDYGTTDADSLNAKPIWQRLLIVAAGVIMNWVLAVLLFTAVYAMGTNVALEDVPPGVVSSQAVIQVMEVVPGSPAERSGMHIGDRIVDANGVAPKDAAAFREQIRLQGEQPMKLTLADETSKREVSVTPAMIGDINRLGLGIALADVAHVSFPLPKAFWLGITTTANLTVLITKAFGGIITDLVVQQKVAQDVSGPIGIVVMSGQVVKQGIAPFLQFLGMLSVNLAVINFLPIPALDGGRALFLIIEKIRRKPMNRKLENKIHGIAFLLLIGLILLVSIHDITRLFQK